MLSIRVLSVILEPVELRLRGGIWGSKWLSTLRHPSLPKFVLTDGLHSWTVNKRPNLKDMILGR